MGYPLTPPPSTLKITHSEFYRHFTQLAAPLIYIKYYHISIIKLDSLLQEVCIKAVLFSYNPSLFRTNESPLIPKSMPL